MSSTIPDSTCIGSDYEEYDENYSECGTNPIIPTITAGFPVIRTTRLTRAGTWVAATIFAGAFWIF